MELSKKFRLLPYAKMTIICSSLRPWLRLGSPWRFRGFLRKEVACGSTDFGAACLEVGDLLLVPEMILVLLSLATEIFIGCPAFLFGLLSLQHLLYHFLAAPYTILKATIIDLL